MPATATSRVDAELYSAPLSPRCRYPANPSFTEECSRSPLSSSANIPARTFRERGNSPLRIQTGYIDVRRTSRVSVSVKEETVHCESRKVTSTSGCGTRQH